MIFLFWWKLFKRHKKFYWLLKLNRSLFYLQLQSEGGREMLGRNKNRKARLRPEVSSPLMAVLGSVLLWWACFPDSIAAALEVQRLPLFQEESWGRTKGELCNKKGFLLCTAQHVTVHTICSHPEICPVITIHNL